MSISLICSCIHTVLTTLPTHQSLSTDLSVNGTLQHNYRKAETGVGPCGLQKKYRQGSCQLYQGHRIYSSFILFSDLHKSHWVNSCIPVRKAVYKSSTLSKFFLFFFTMQCIKRFREPSNNTHLILRSFQCKTEPFHSCPSTVQQSTVPDVITPIV